MRRGALARCFGEALWRGGDKWAKPGKRFALLSRLRRSSHAQSLYMKTSTSKCPWVHAAAFPELCYGPHAAHSP
eukprot:scaffold422_cov247-Pinguiococcus_pyrenoidosus.AAC.4